MGAPADAQIAHSLFYQGIPGKELPYREYKMNVVGSTGRAFVIVRAQNPGSSWTFWLQSIEKR